MFLFNFNEGVKWVSPLLQADKINSQKELSALLQIMVVDIFIVHPPSMCNEIPLL